MMEPSTSLRPMTKTTRPADPPRAQGPGAAAAAPASSPAPAAAASPAPAAASGDAILSCSRLTVRYGATTVLHELDLELRPCCITAVIGPSGCGKSTLIRTFNRMNDFIPGFAREGEVLYRGIDVYANSLDPVELRRRVGMVFQKPNPFPKTVYQNVVWGPKINGYRGDLGALAEAALRKAALWDEVKDRLHGPALALSGGQQQRLCLARTLAMQPDVILMDEPCSALDPISTSRIEDLLFELKDRYTIVIVTHNMQQAGRVSDWTAFLEGGRLVEFGETEQVFTRPREKRTEDYVMGRFG